MIRKKCHSNNMESCIEVHGDVTTDVLQGDSIHRIKTKPIVGHPKRRLKSALEKKMVNLEAKQHMLKNMLVTYKKKIVRQDRLNHLEA